MDLLSVFIFASRFATFWGMYLRQISPGQLIIRKSGIIDCQICVIQTAAVLPAQHFPDFWVLSNIKEAVGEKGQHLTHFTASETTKMAAALNHPAIHGDLFWRYQLNKSVLRLSLYYDFS